MLLESMKITEENINSLPISDYEKGLLSSLLKDLEDINDKGDKILYINYIDQHTEYSPECTDPCPDFYGMFQIINSETRDSLGVEMTIEDLDTSLCLLYNYVVE